LGLLQQNLPGADITQRSNRPAYSITSSARANSVGGMVRPSALALSNAARRQMSGIFGPYLTGKDASDRHHAKENGVHYLGMAVQSQYTSK
jgi:hypothetical protein